MVRKSLGIACSSMTSTDVFGWSLSSAFEQLSCAFADGSLNRLAGAVTKILDRRGLLLLLRLLIACAAEGAALLRLRPVGRSWLLNIVLWLLVLRLVVLRLIKLGVVGLIEPTVGWCVGGLPLPLTLLLSLIHI